MSRWLLASLMVIVGLGCSGEVPKPTPAVPESDLGAPAAMEPPSSPPTGQTEPVAGSAAKSTSPAFEAASPDGHNRLTRDELSAGWLRLFDGHTLFGWQPNSATNWRVVDGVIVADGDEKGLLVTTTRWADYELRCDFRIAAGGNSGLFLRTPKTPTNPKLDCYELNICDTHPEFKSASLVGRAQPTTAVTADGEWHSFHVTVSGPKVAVKFDDQLVTEYTDETAAPLTSGFIGLQMNGGQAEFRNVFLRPLGLADLFDGQSLAGWRVVPGSKGEFKVEDETIRITGGRGFLETERTAGNFVFQFEAITHGDALNSGVFFRAMTGTEATPSHGYEFQIQNGVKDNDRTQPADFGTGAIFRRVAARRVVSSDREWLTATLVADGPHITTWVDGVQVVDWIDERPANENPREGLRVEPGHFSLQAHDPTTNLQFRKLRLADLP